MEEKLGVYGHQVCNALSKSSGGKKTQIERGKGKCKWRKSVNI